MKELSEKHKAALLKIHRASCTKPSILMQLMVKDLNLSPENAALVIAHLIAEDYLTFGSQYPKLYLTEKGLEVVAHIKEELRYTKTRGKKND